MSEDTAGHGGALGGRLPETSANKQRGQPWPSVLTTSDMLHSHHEEAL